MAKLTKKLQKKAKLEQKKKFKTVFMNGKQVKVKRPVLIEGLAVDDFIKRNADPIFLHQHEMWEDLVDTSNGYYESDEHDS